MRREKKWERSIARLQRPAVVGPPVSKEGPFAAALLASGIGSAALGLVTILSALSRSLKQLMVIYEPVGPVSGITIIPVALWLIVWVILHFKWRDKEKSFPKIFAATMLLLMVGLAGTLPPVYKLFVQ